jgi:hypothetical protein
MKKTLLTLIALIIFHSSGFSGPGNTSWMINGKYGIFLHYQYRILLGYSIRTNPQFPEPSRMNAADWNKFVGGFDVKRFADQMSKTKVGWVMFCLDDHFFAWPCAPNKTFDNYTGYAPGEKCSHRDLLMDVAEALHKKGIKLIVYYAGLNGYMKEPRIMEGLKDTERGMYNEKAPLSAESRSRRIAILREYADRYKDKIAGWWFDGMEPDTYNGTSDNWQTIQTVVRDANPDALIAFSCGKGRIINKDIDDFTGGDTWTKQDLKKLTPDLQPPKDNILWHGKIYCGNIYHGMGNSNQFTDQELIDWIDTCNKQGGVCTLDWPFDPKTGLIKDFGKRQMINIRNKIKLNE